GHRVGVTDERRERLTVIGVPESYRVVLAGAGQPVPIRAERHSAHPPAVAGQGITDGLAGVGVPQPHIPVLAGAGQPMPVGAERHTEYLFGVAGQWVTD